MRGVTAIRCENVDNLDEIEVASVECYRCDPDNPLAVPRPSCPDCRGTGRAPVKFIPILREIREARSQPRQKAPSEDSLYLEY
jgi:hypothetical protein